MYDTLNVVNPEGREFKIKVVKVGQPYGVSGCLINDHREAFVEFYDVSNKEQFVQRYSRSTIMNKGIQDVVTGLLLDGGSKEWYVGGENMIDIIKWLAFHG